MFNAILAWFEARYTPVALAANRLPPMGLRAFVFYFVRQFRAAFLIRLGLVAIGAVADSTLPIFTGMVVGFLSGQMRQSIMFMRQNQSDIDGRLVDTNIAEHKAIYEAILSRSPEAARDAMQRHIRNAARRLGYDLSGGPPPVEDAARF